MNPLTLDNRAFSPLFLDPVVAERFSLRAITRDFLAFEEALAEALAETGLVEKSTTEQAIRACETFILDEEALSAACLQDGLPVPHFVRQLKAQAGEEASTALHRGATSQDLIDTSFSLAFKDLNPTLEKRLKGIISTLEKIAEKFGDRAMMGRTRMQAALPIQVRDRIKAWHAPLRDLDRTFASLRAEVEVLQFGGAVGTRAGLEGQGEAIIAIMAKSLGLGNPGRVWHSDRQRLVCYGDWLSRLTGALGKIGLDLALMAQQGVEEVEFSGAGTSSAMPHKQNPVRAELLVAFARYNAAHVSALHQSLLHEQERSGAAWTLEWMTWPAMLMTTAKALEQAEQLLSSIENLGRED